MAAAGKQRRPGQVRTLVILAVAVGALLIALIGMSTREASNEYEDIQGVQDMRMTIGGERQLGDRLGSEDAPVAIQAFLDAQSETYRDNFFETIPPLIGSQVRSGDVKLLYRNRSLTRNATELSFYGIEAAMNQNYGWQFAYLMFRNQELAKEVRLDEDFLTRIAESIENMDLIEWKEDFEAGLEAGSQMTAELQAQDQIAIDLEIRDKPAVVVNGPGGTEVVQDAPDLNEIEAAIDKVR